VTVAPRPSTPALLRRAYAQGERAGTALPRREWLRLSAAAALAWLAAPAARAEERIRVRQEDGEVKDLRLEDYVAGVLAGEMPASFPSEAQRAQAVAARSYALTRKIEAQAAGKPWDIGAGVLTQVYRGRHSPAARAAADATLGEVLVLGVMPVEAYFHAVCGGRTETGAAALGRDLPYLVSVECGYCDDAPGARWRREFSGAELGKVAALGGAADAVRVASRTAADRAERVELARGGRAASLAAADLRQRLGFARLPSVAFEVDSAGAAAGFAFIGRGQGHGAGLCQHGAAGMARVGKAYGEILAHYYPGTEIVKMY
jgi:stage II sporulation protein D